MCCQWAGGASRRDLMLDFGWLAGDDSLCAHDSGRMPRSGRGLSTTPTRRGRPCSPPTSVAVHVRIAPGPPLTADPARRPSIRASGTAACAPRAQRGREAAYHPAGWPCGGQGRAAPCAEPAGPMVRPFRASIRVTRINPACRLHTRSAGGRQGRLPSECVYPRAPYMLAVAAAGSGSGPGRAELTGEADTAGKARLR